MWKHILQISLIFCMFIVIAYIYRLNLQQINKKNKMIEKFKDSVEDPKPYSNEDFVLYANIIGIFKTQIGKEPSQDELFRCFNKIRSNDMSLAELDTLLVKEPKNYRLFLFPEAEQILLSNNDHLDYDKLVEEARKDVNKEETLNKQDYENSTEEEEDSHIESTLESTKTSKTSKTELYDKDNKVQYIINRPTVYNIHNGTTKGLECTNPSDIEDTIENTTLKILNSLKNTSENIKPKAIEDDGELVDESEYVQSEDVENNKQNVRNRCQTQKELDDQNKLSISNHQRNLNKMEYECNRNKKKETLAHEYDDMILRHDQLWKMPERRPPVCSIDSKKKCNVNPVEVQSALIGTLLNDASSTSVGSILPKFQFKEK
jgi:hypothetical protein|uniref:Uncharacterized protein n=1 Tax=viral metagenome TaxID=1070528 RepID=A0A6C0BRP1_9ZZZZ